MMSKIFVGLLVLSSFSVLAQNIEYTLSIPGDTSKNYYVTVYPQGKITGCLILLPGFGELPKETLIESNIFKFASSAGYLTIIPALGDRSFFYIDKISHQKLEQFIDEVFKKYNLNENSFFIGGHSFGGTMAVQYTERAYLSNSSLKKPAGVFAIDPPLDIERLYHCMTTTNRPAKNPVSVQEDNYVSNRIKAEFKNEPETNPEFFWDISPYSQSDREHRSLKTLVTIPVRVYNEPDINWYIDNRAVDFYCINAIDSAAMINWLKSLGNTKAELITTTNKGYRASRKMRHIPGLLLTDKT
jgi:hypothetical protein